MALVYNLINNGTEYEIGAGSCTAGNVIIPSTYLGKPVTSIGRFAFTNCSTITSVSIPGSVTSINNRAFYRCANLQNVIFSEGLTSIGVEAFRECSNLESIIFPTTLNYIGASAFVLSFRFQSAPTITIQSNISTSSNSSDGPFRGSDIANVIVFPGVSSLPTYLFTNCANLVNANLPNSLIEIGAGCFQGCVALNLTSLPPNLQFIGNSAFFQCLAIVDIKIPDTVTYLGIGAFASCSNLQNIVLSKNITSLQAFTFSDCILLKSPLFLSNKVTSIGDFCFSRCFSLRKIYFEGNAPNFGLSIFNNIVLALVKLYRKKNFVTGWPSSVQGVSVVLWSDNIIKSGGSGKLIGKK